MRFLILLLGLNLFPVFSQQEFGVESNIGIGSFLQKDVTGNPTFIAQPNAALNVGVFFNAYRNNHFFFSFGAHFLQLNAIMKESGVRVVPFNNWEYLERRNGYYKYNTSYFSLPISANYKKGRFEIGLGAKLNLSLFSERITYVNYRLRSLPDVYYKDPINEKETFEVFSKSDVGVQLRAGLALNGRTKLNLEIYQGITHVDTYKTTKRNQSCLLGLRYTLKSTTPYVDYQELKKQRKLNDKPKIKDDENKNEVNTKKERPKKGLEMGSLVYAGVSNINNYGFKSKTKKYPLMPAFRLGVYGSTNQTKKAFVELGILVAMMTNQIYEEKTFYPFDEYPPFPPPAYSIEDNRSTDIRLELPLLVGVNFRQFYFKYGVQVAALINSFEKTIKADTDKNFENKFNITSKLDDKEWAQKYDLGGIVGLGFRLSESFRLELNYQHSLIRERHVYEGYNNQFTVGLSYNLLMHD